MGGKPTSTELTAASDEDLQFVAHVMHKKGKELEEFRGRALATQKDLKHIGRSATAHIWWKQPKSVQQVARMRDIS